MNDIFRLLIIVISLTIALASYFLVIGALFEKRVTKTIALAKQLPGRSLAIGFVNFLFFGVIAMLLFSFAENVDGVFRVILTIPALIITILLTVILSFGLAGMVNMLGERVFPEQSAWKKTIWGTIIFAFACALPFVGWFLLFPYMALTGLGAVILGFFQREKIE